MNRSESVTLKRAYVDLKDGPKFEKEWKMKHLTLVESTFKPSSTNNTIRLESFTTVGEDC